MAPHILCVGGEDHALRIPFLIALQSRGFRVTAVGTGDEIPFMRARIPYQRYHFDRFGAWRSHGAAIRDLARIVRMIAPDLVQTFDTKPGLLAPLAIKGAIPTVRTINGLGWVFSSRSLRSALLRPAYLSVQRLAAMWTAATVFQNRDDNALFNRWMLLGKSRAMLIPGSGIDVAAFEAAYTAEPRSSPGALRAELDVEHAPVVLTVSRLTTQKGIPTLLRAAALVHQQLPDVRFLLVGPRQSEGPFAVNEADIEQHAPYVKALGARSDIPALLGLARVFAFPTEYREGIPRVLLEAGLAGVPIVTTGMPGCTDVVRDGWNGYCVPSRNPQALADRILYLLRNSEAAASMGRRSNEFIRRTFGLGGVSRQYADLYTQILETRRGHFANGRRVAPQPSVI